MNFVITLNTGHNVLHDNARASMREAARRWKADYLEIVTPTGDTKQHHYYQKLRLADHLPDGSRIAYFDADCVIRSDCPSLFDIVPEGQLGWVRTHHPSHSGATHHVYRPMADFAAKFGVRLDIDHEYLNSGLMVFDMPAHRPLFAEANRMVSEIGFDSRWMLADQGYLSVARKKLNLSVFWIPPLFNFCGDALWAGWTPTMNAFCYHFCGPINKSIAIPRTVWDDLGPDRYIPGTGVRRWHNGKPTHLTGTDEIPFFIQQLSRIRHGKIVELGSYLGGSTWYGAQIARDNWSEYYAIDSWQGSSDLGVDDSIFRGFEMNMRDAGLADIVKVIKSHSIEAAARFEDESLDLVFVDADHSYKGCLGDIDAYWPKLKPDGILLGHDYGSHDGVTLAVNERFGQPEELSVGEYAIWKMSKML
jgi:hypothetical protein